MTLAQLQAQHITALKSKDTLRLQVIREIISQVKNKEIAVGHELTEDEITAVIQKIQKEALESIESFTKGGRQDLIDESTKQLEIIRSFLPPELSDTELEQSIRTILKTHEAAIAANPKSAIGLCIKELKSKASSSRILNALKTIQPS